MHVKSSPLTLVLCAAITLVNLFGAETLESVLARMDAAAATFRSMTAQLKQVSHTAVINDTTTETGVVFMKRPKPNDTRLLIDFRQPNPRSAAFRGNKGEIYYPKIQTVHEYDLRRYKSLVDQYLLLGFGSTSRDLRKNYNLKLLGEEQVLGKNTARLELIPKSKEALEHLRKVEMWIPAGEGYPIQQKFYYPSGDYHLASYSDLRWNPDLSDDAVTLKLPKGVKREFPQR